MEVLLASFAAAILLAAMYGLFGRAVKLRDQATERTRDARVRARAISVLRNDLLNAHLVGAEMSGGFKGEQTAPNTSRFPGYLRFTTATGRDTAESLYGDTQEVEYYIDTDPESANPEAGVLVRTIDRVLLAETREITKQELLMRSVQAMDVEFYDGSEWQTSWETNETATELPKAVRVTIHPYLDTTDPKARTTPPLELLVPWTTALATKPATTTTSAGP
jgi:hypothetical protein